MMSNDNRSVSESVSNSEVGGDDAQVVQGGGGDLAISGYLLKKSKDGIWQRRYFETNGNYLTYYKNKKMQKLLAALCLDDVGDISVTGDTRDMLGAGVIFQIELKDRNYQLRAQTMPQAEQWVRVLNDIKKANSKASPTAAAGEGGQGLSTGNSSVSPPFRSNLSIDNGSVSDGSVKMIDSESRRSSCCCGWF